MLQNTLQRYPAMTTTAITFFSVTLLLLLKLLGPQQPVLFNWPRLFALNAISLVIIWLLCQFNWQKQSGLTQSPANWHTRWWLATLPLLMLALLNLTSVQWQQLSPTPVNLSAWLLSNLSTGLFEEILLRGLCFLVLYRAWGTSRRGLYAAAFFQAAIFGLAHLGNLYHMPVLDVLAQVIFATLIGVGFAGLVYLSKSLWPAIIVHTCINSAGTINEYLHPGYEGPQSPGLVAYAIVVLLFLLLAALPGCIYLKKSPLVTTG